MGPSRQHDVSGQRRYGRNEASKSGAKIFCRSCEDSWVFEDKCHGDRRFCSSCGGDFWAMESGKSKKRKSRKGKSGGAEDRSKGGSRSGAELSLPAGGQGAMGAGPPSTLRAFVLKELESARETPAVASRCMVRGGTAGAIAQKVAPAVKQKVKDGCRRASRRPTVELRKDRRADDVVHRE